MTYPRHKLNIITKQMLFENTAELTERGVRYVSETSDETTFIVSTTDGSQQRRYMSLAARQKMM